MDVCMWHAYESMYGRMHVACMCLHTWVCQQVSVCTCVCMHVCVCAHAPTALFLCSDILPTSPFDRQGMHSPQTLLTGMWSCSLLWKCRYLYVKIWKRVQSLLSDLQNHPANSAWTTSPARWPFSNTLAVQTGVLLLIPAPAPRQAHETAYSVCALGRQPHSPAPRRRRWGDCQAGLGRDDAAAGRRPRGFGVCN